MSIEVFSDVIRQARERRGLSISEAAKRIKCPKASVIRWETTDRLPNRWMLVQVAYVYKVDQADLIRKRDEAKQLQDDKTLKSA